MKNENGDSDLKQNKLNIEPFKEIPIRIINDKLYKNELEIEDILQNDKCINDLITNKNSRFLKMMTFDNINKLINYCLNPNAIKNKNSKIELRYPYYSSELLCSQCVLFFEKSINNIKKYNNIKSKTKNIETKNKNEIDLHNVSSGDIDIDIDDKENKENKENIKKIEENKENIEKKEENNKNNENEINNNFIQISEYIESYDKYLDSANKQNEFYSDFNEKYIDILSSHMSEPSIKKENKSLQSINEYDEEVNDIIYNILDEIFKTLDIVNINNNENQTYIGYFQKIINYSLIKESKIIINYLFKDNPPKIKKLYKFLNNFSIKNILENLLNIISDLEEDEENNESKNSKFLKIINDLFNELNNDHNFIKSEFICELIINTLITNNEKQLIQFIFKESGMEIIKNIIKNIINKNNNDKLLLGIIDIIYYLNNTIMNSLTDCSFLIFKENKIFFNNDYRNINTFEYHYNCLKNISKKNIIDAFKQHSEKYLNILVDIYFIIKEKIKENKNILKNKFNNIIPISIRYKKKFGLKNLYEWKLILSCLKNLCFSFKKRF